MMPSPSMTNACPFTAEAPSEHSQTATEATWEGWSAAPVGDTRRSRAAALSLIRPSGPWSIGVLTMPGRTLLQRTPERMYSAAAERVKPRIPCLAAV